jgi:translation initiation factor IF-1
MPKKNKRRANKNRNMKTKILQYAEKNQKQVYAKVMDPLGGSPPNFRIKVLNEGVKIATVSGNAAKTKILREDWVLAEPLCQSKDREKYIIQLKYSKDQVKILRKENLLQEYATDDHVDNSGFQFGNDQDDNLLNVDDNIDQLLDDL